MKRLLILIPILLLSLNIISEPVYKALVEEGDYYRAAGEYKAYAFYSGIEDSAEYYLHIAAIYSLSDFQDMALKYSNKASMYANSEEQLNMLSMINAFLYFKDARYREAIFEMEMTVDSSTLTGDMVFFREMINKETKKYFVPEHLPEAIQSDLNLYLKKDLKDPMHATMLSSLYPGIGEFYAGDYVSAIRDFTVTTMFVGLSAYAFLKNRNAYTIDKIEFTGNWFKNRDWVLFYVIYSTFVARFFNGARTNSEEAAYTYNEKLYSTYLKPYHQYIIDIFTKRIVDYL